MWKECKIVHGSPKHPQSQGSVERANADVERMVMQWMDDNNATNWSWGIQFIGHMKNNRYHEGIKQIPYVLRYGQPCRVGLSRMNLPPLLLNGIQTEEQLQEALEQATVFVSSLRGITEPANSADNITVVESTENDTNAVFEPDTTDQVQVDTTTENYVESIENDTNAVDEPDTTDQVQVETTTENYVESTENDTNAVDEPDEPMTSDRDTVETTTANDVEATDSITDRETAAVNEAGYT